VNDVDVAQVITVAFAHVLESETYHWNVVQLSEYQFSSE